MTRGDQAMRTAGKLVMAALLAGLMLTIAAAILVTSAFAHQALVHLLPSV